LGPPPPPLKLSQLFGSMNASDPHLSSPDQLLSSPSHRFPQSLAPGAKKLLISLMGSLKEAIIEFAARKSYAAKYESVPPRDSDDSSTSRPIHIPSSNANNKIYPFVAGLLAAFVVFVFSLSTISVLTPAPHTAAEREAEEWNYCGRSSRVAMERGCVMEPFFYGWMPPQCSWKELSDQWPVFEDRKWYSDANMTVPISQEDLWSGKHIYIYASKLVTHQFIHILYTNDY
jgi:hypothetical protein